MSLRTRAVRNSQQASCLPNGRPSFDEFRQHLFSRSEFTLDGAERETGVPADKIRRMRDAGISVADEIGDIPRLVQERLDGAA